MSLCKQNIGGFEDEVSHPFIRLAVFLRVDRDGSVEQLIGRAVLSVRAIKLAEIGHRASGLDVRCPQGLRIDGKRLLERRLRAAVVVEIEFNSAQGVERKTQCADPARPTWPAPLCTACCANGNAAPLRPCATNCCACCISCVQRACCACACTIPARPTDT